MVVIVREENKRLFGDQVNDHIEKLNDLMSLASGAVFNEHAIRRACLATRLLEGSTRMLGLESWSFTLKKFRGLLEHAAESGKVWDEQLSQIVSEILETEEQMVAEIITGEIEEIGRVEVFEGLQKEIEALAVEGEDPPAAPDPPAVGGAGPAERAPVEIAERFSTLTTLIGALAHLQELFNEYLAAPSRGERLARDLELALGESEFYLGLVGDSLRRLDKGGKPFKAKISCGAVFEGLKDFFTTHARLRDWRVRLETRSVDCAFDRDAASAMAVVLDSCLFDIGRRYECRGDASLDVEVAAESRGSHIVVSIRDNGRDYLCDCEIDREDEAAFYHCLREVRGRLEIVGGLLWIEPNRGRDGRFRFTFPLSADRTDFLICTASGKQIAIPCHAVETVLPSGAAGAPGRSIDVAGVRVDVHALDEIAFEEDVTPRDHDGIVVAGIAEKRIGIPIEGSPRTVEGVAEQITEEGWASLSRSTLNIGEAEYPVIDIHAIIDRVNYVHGMESPSGEGGACSDVEGFRGVNKEVPVPRA